uniref:Uncharacterized LOC101242583 n=1 Tax=Ciona intestinalis TaxID=7719 RepID=H2XXB8_CIOIN|nr:uncharacterized protein LOC101242583 [Ciona intestinalis]|eukprot:XP_004226149.1 uncharacterized protein LOC101242583 [Ciona intestinalis]
MFQKQKSLNLLSLLLSLIFITGCQSYVAQRGELTDPSSFRLSDMYQIFGSKNDGQAAGDSNNNLFELMLFKWLCSTDAQRNGRFSFCKGDRTTEPLRILPDEVNDQSEFRRRGWRENMLHKLMD